MALLPPPRLAEGVAQAELKPLAVPPPLLTVGEGEDVGCPPEALPGGEREVIAETDGKEESLGCGEVLPVAIVLAVAVTVAPAPEALSSALAVGGAESEAVELAVAEAQEEELGDDICVTRGAPLGVLLAETAVEAEVVALPLLAPLPVASADGVGAATLGVALPLACSCVSVANAEAVTATDTEAQSEAVAQDVCVGVPQADDVGAKALPLATGEIVRGAEGDGWLVVLSARPGDSLLCAEDEGSKGDAVAPRPLAVAAVLAVFDGKRGEPVPLAEARPVGLSKSEGVALGETRRGEGVPLLLTVPQAVDEGFTADSELTPEAVGTPL